METVAVYQEAIIGTYGFEILEGLFMVALKVSSAQLPFVGAAMAGLKTCGEFQAFFTQPGEEAGSVEIRFLQSSCRLPDFPLSEDGIDGEVWKIAQITGPVDLLRFHGPHFGDRFGIAAAVFLSLSTGGFSVLASGCSQSAVYLVLPGGMAGAGKRLLFRAFCEPKRGDV